MTCTIQISVSLQILGIFLTCCLANTIRIEFDEVIKIRNGHDLHTHSETQKTTYSTTFDSFVSYLDQVLEKFLSYLIGHLTKPSASVNDSKTLSRFSRNDIRKGLLLKFLHHSIHTKMVFISLNNIIFYSFNNTLSQLQYLTYVKVSKVYSQYGNTVVFNICTNCYRKNL